MTLYKFFKRASITICKSDVNCLNFRVLLGNDKDEWIYYITKLGEITETYVILAEDEQWISEWPKKQLDKYNLNIVEASENFSVMNEIIAFMFEK